MRFDINVLNGEALCAAFALAEGLHLRTLSQLRAAADSVGPLPKGPDCWMLMVNGVAQSVPEYHEFSKYLGTISNSHGMRSTLANGVWTTWSKRYRRSASTGDTEAEAIMRYRVSLAFGDTVQLPDLEGLTTGRTPPPHDSHSHLHKMQSNVVGMPLPVVAQEHTKVVELDDKLKVVECLSNEQVHMLKFLINGSVAEHDLDSEIKGELISLNLAVMVCYNSETDHVAAKSEAKAIVEAYEKLKGEV